MINHENIHTTELIENFSLWTLISSIQLTSVTSDMISWKWTTNGTYSAMSAYRAQFHGPYPIFATDKIWKAHAKPK